jgi:hypothetical protein
MEEGALVRWEEQALLSFHAHGLRIVNVDVPKKEITYVYGRHLPQK